MSSELSGIMKSVEATYNDRVKVGQILAGSIRRSWRRRSCSPRASLDSARVKLLQVQATVTEAVHHLARLRAGARAERQQAALADGSGRGGGGTGAGGCRRSQRPARPSRRPRPHWTPTRRILAKAVIRSPINGVVLTRSVEPGQTVAASLQAPVLFTLAEDLTQMELHVYVDEADVGKVKEGQAATFTVDAYPDRTFHARIAQVRFGSKTVSGVVTYETVLELDNADLSLRPGMTATADITVQNVRELCLLVPERRAALRAPGRGREESSRRRASGAALPGPAARAAEAAAEASGDKKAAAGVDAEGWTTHGHSGHCGRDGRDLTEITGGDVKPGMELVLTRQWETR